jgi:hypothetical protein
MDVLDAYAVVGTCTHDVAHEKEVGVYCRAPSSPSTSASDSSVFDDSDSSKAVGFDSDEETEREADLDPELAASIEHHMEAMNAAAEEVNDIQGALKKCARERDGLEERWASTSARLATAVGMDGVAKAAPYFKQLYLCEAVREKMEHVTREYQALLARNASRRDDSAVQLEARLAACVAEHEASKQTLNRLKSQLGLSRRLLDAVMPYFDAEDEHRAQMSDSKIAVERYQRRLESSKLRYSIALRSLEDLSERAHTQRARFASCGTLT